VRKTHGGVKFTTPILWKQIFKLNQCSFLAPFLPSSSAIVTPVTPGICLYNKLLSELEIYPTARQTTNLPYQALVTKDKYTLAVSAIVVYEVTDLVKAYGEAWDIEDLIKDISLAKVRLLLTSMKYDDVIEDQESIDLSLTSSIKEELDDYGINVINSFFTDLAPSSNTLLMGSTGANLLPSAGLD
jgi:regulator of protease activity HflC (stomatin/prohibitin superfamily)